MSIGEIHVMILIENNLATLHELCRSSRKGIMVPFFLFTSRVRMLTSFIEDIGV